MEEGKKIKSHCLRRMKIMDVYNNLTSGICTQKQQYVVTISLFRRGVTISHPLTKHLLSWPWLECSHSVISNKLTNR